MAQTNFTTLGLEEKLVWSRDLWMQARNASFTMRFAGAGPNSMIQRITELTRTEKGHKAVVTLVTDLDGDGVGGDNTLEGNEEQIKAYDMQVQIDQLRNGNRTTGRYADQGTIINFRETSRDVLAYWLADRIDQMGFLTMAGLSYTLKNNDIDTTGSRTSTTLPNLAFAADVTAPSSSRVYNWQSGALATADTSTIAATDTADYSMLVQAKAKAKTEYIRGIRGPGNTEYYHVFMTPQAYSKLKLDTDYINAVVNAAPRGDANPFWSGATMTVDGLIIHEFRHVPNNAANPTWGATTNVEGCKCIFAGAQAMGLADLGLPYWEEKTFDYGNQLGISTGKLFGMKKSVFSADAGTLQDFGVMVINIAQ